MRHLLDLRESVTANPISATAAKGPGDSDTEPLQFWVEIKGGKPSQEIELTLHGYGRPPDMCLAMTHEYAIRLEDENCGSRRVGMESRTTWSSPNGKARRTKEALIGEDSVEKEQVFLPDEMLPVIGVCSDGFRQGR